MTHFTTQYVAEFSDSEFVLKRFQDILFGIDTLKGCMTTFHNTFHDTIQNTIHDTFHDTLLCQEMCYLFTFVTDGVI